MKILIISLLFAILNHAAFCGPIVNTKQGQMEGFVHETPKFTCDAFLGIPFAKPPIKERRFKKPYPLPEDPEAIFSADRMPNRCLQSIDGRLELFDREPESEDCLYLNIFRPAQEKGSSATGLLPVMVYIHGGAFVTGSARQYGMNGPCNNIVSKDVILVIIQYRLGLFGFLSTGDANAIGNWGLWDQIEALGWVQRNIASFGGDPNSVTIFGESAGAMSVSLISYSDITQDLYHRTIQQSGSILNFGVFMRESIAESTKTLAEFACSLEDPTSAEILQCVMAIPAVELLGKNYELFQKLLKGEITGPVPPAGISWVPVVDGELVKHNVFNIHQGANSKPAIIGTTAQEMAWFVQPPDYMKDIVHEAFLLVINEDQISWENFKLPILSALPTSTDTKKQLSVLNAAKYVYVDSHEAEKNKTKLLEQYITMKFGDFSCGGSGSDENDTQIGDQIGTLFTNFAKTGNPHPADPEWPQWFSPEIAYNYRINLQSTVDDHYHRDRVLFWTQTVPQFLSGHQEL